MVVISYTPFMYEKERYYFPNKKISKCFATPLSSCSKSDMTWKN